MIIGEKMKGGGRIDVEKENDEWILKLHTEFDEIYHYKDGFKKVNEALHMKMELEREAQDAGASKLLHIGKDVLWFKI